MVQRSQQVNDCGTTSFRGRRVVLVQGPNQSLFSEPGTLFRHTRPRLPSSCEVLRGWSGVRLSILRPESRGTAPRSRTRTKGTDSLTSVQWWKMTGIRVVVLPQTLLVTYLFSVPPILLSSLVWRCSANRVPVPVPPSPKLPLIRADVRPMGTWELPWGLGVNQWSLQWTGPPGDQRRIVTDP